MSDAETISIFLLTYSRCHLLRQCVENVLAKTSALTSEIVIWDNASTDDTAAYLDSLTDPRIKVVHAPTNIGMNAYDRAVQLTHGTYLDFVGAVSPAPLTAADVSRLARRAAKRLDAGF